jgi:hypothetical protein
MIFWNRGFSRRTGSELIPSRIFPSPGFSPSPRIFPQHPLEPAGVPGGLESLPAPVLPDSRRKRALLRSRNQLEGHPLTIN